MVPEPAPLQVSAAVHRTTCCCSSECLVHVGRELAVVAAEGALQEACITAIYLDCWSKRRQWAAPVPVAKLAREAASLQTIGSQLLACRCAAAAMAHDCRHLVLGCPLDCRWVDCRRWCPTPPSPRSF